MKRIRLKLHPAQLSMVVMLALLVLALDQGTKAAIQSFLLPGDQRPVIPGLFSLTLTFNPGVAFGLFAGLPDAVRLAVLSVTTLLAVVAVLAFLFGEYGQTAAGRFGLGLILGGAVGNIVDRVRLGHVVDFLLVYYQEWHWPAFNVADSAICIGVGVLLFFGGASRRVDPSPRSAT